MSKPDFIVIGAMKCGTSTLHAQLEAQPGFFMTTPKEPNFFSDDDIYAKGADWYRALFAGAGETDIKGEASTHYTKLPTYPETLERLASAAPDVKMIYVMRHPMDRLSSHFIHEWSVGAVGGDIDQAVSQDSIFVDYGRYAYQISPFLERFGAERILPVFLERMNLYPDTELKRIARFLGAAGEIGWRDDLGARNVSRERIRRFPLDDLLIKSGPAKALRHALAPKGLRNWVKGKLQMRERPTLSEDKSRVLEVVFDEDLARLGALLGAELNCANFKQTVCETTLDWAARD